MFGFFFGFQFWQSSFHQIVKNDFQFSLGHERSRIGLYTTIGQETLYRMLDYFAPITRDTFSLVPGCLSISCKTSVSSVMTCSKGNTGSAVPLFMACIFCWGLGTKETASARPLRTRSLSLNHRTWNEGITAVSHLMILWQSRKWFVDGK